MTARDHATLAKLPAVTTAFWVIKILATTLGETAGDTVSLSMNLGYLTATVVFLAILIMLVWRQVPADRCSCSAASSHRSRCGIAGSVRCRSRPCMNPARNCSTS